MTDGYLLIHKKDFSIFPIGFCHNSVDAGDAKVVIENMTNAKIEILPIPTISGYIPASKGIRLYKLWMSCKGEYSINITIPDCELLDNIRKANTGWWTKSTDTTIHMSYAESYHWGTSSIFVAEQVKDLYAKYFSDYPPLDIFTVKG